MKKIVTYECGFCGKSFKKSIECLAHECSSHIGISVDTYEKWRNLKKELLQASSNLHDDKIHDGKASEAFNKAIENMMNFEKEHNVSEKDLKKVGL